MKMRNYNETWYRLKKSILLFPLAPADQRASRPFLSSTALAPVYARIYAEAGPLRRAWFRLQRAIFMAWASRRARQVAREFGLSPEEASGMRSLALRRFIGPRDVVICEVKTDHDAIFSSAASKTRW